MWFTKWLNYFWLEWVWSYQKVDKQELYGQKYLARQKSAAKWKGPLPKLTLLGDNVPPNRRSSITSRWKCFWWRIFFTFHIHILDALWLNFMAKSFQLLKLWTFFEGRYSQNDDFTVKTMCNRQILEIVVKCEKLNIYLKLCQGLNLNKGTTSIKIILQFLLFSLSFYCSL